MAFKLGKLKLWAEARGSCAEGLLSAEAPLLVALDSVMHTILHCTGLYYIILYSLCFATIFAIRLWDLALPRLAEAFAPNFFRGRA